MDIGKGARGIRISINWRRSVGCIRDLQTTGKWLQQVHVPAIVDANGNLSESTEEQRQM